MYYNNEKKKQELLNKAVYERKMAEYRRQQEEAKKQEQAKKVGQTGNKIYRTGNSMKNIGSNLNKVGNKLISSNNNLLQKTGNLTNKLGNKFVAGGEKFNTVRDGIGSILKNKLSLAPTTATTGATAAGPIGLAVAGAMLIGNLIKSAKAKRAAKAMAASQKASMEAIANKKQQQLGLAQGMGEQQQNMQNQMAQLQNNINVGNAQNQAQNSELLNYKQSINPEDYRTQLNNEEQNGFNNWVNQMRASGAIHPNDNFQDYDMQGYWKNEVLNGTNLAGGNAQNHFTDKYKMPNHETFSNESQYYNNDNAKYAGSWEGDNFIAPNLNQTSAPEEKGGFLNKLGGIVGDGLKLGLINKIKGVVPEPIQEVNRAVPELDNSTMEAARQTFLPKDGGESVKQSLLSKLGFNFGNNQNQVENTPTGGAAPVGQDPVKQSLLTKLGNGFNDVINGYQDNLKNEFKEGDLYKKITNNPEEKQVGQVDENGKLIVGTDYDKKHTIMNKLGELVGTGQRVLANPAVQGLIAGGIAKANGSDFGTAAEYGWNWGREKALSDYYRKKINPEATPSVLGGYDYKDYTAEVDSQTKQNKDNREQMKYEDDKEQQKAENERENKKLDYLIDRDNRKLNYLINRDNKRIDLYNRKLNEIIRNNNRNYGLNSIKANAYAKNKASAKNGKIEVKPSSKKGYVKVYKDDYYWDIPENEYDEFMAELEELN